MHNLNATSELLDTLRRSDNEVRGAVAGMGAIVTPEGTAFRVWAPNAERVQVIGDFNQWRDSPDASMHEEANGHWYAFIPEARMGQEYRYLVTTNGKTESRIDPRAKKVTNSVGNGVIWRAESKPNPLARVVSQDELVIYELHIGSFNPVSHGSPGTFRSAIEKLDYLKDLGVNAVEVMPIAEFAGDFSWGYNPAHPFAVESAYGGPEGFIEFVNAAHARGIAVILDVVYNHFGPSDLSLWQFDGWSENEQGGIYFYNDWRASTPWGDTRPDYGREEVRSYIRDNAMMWLEEFGVDGLRWDMSVYIRTYRGNTGDPGDDLKEGWGLMQWVNRDIHAAFPHAICIAEDLRDSEWLVKDQAAGGAGFTAQWCATFVHTLRAAVIVALDEQRPLQALADTITGRFDGDAFKRVIYSESHDEVANGKARVPTEIDANEADGYYARKRSTLGAAVALTAPGVPMLFQGQEFLEDEWFRDSVPLDWSKLSRFEGIHRLYRDLVNLRLNRQGCSLGLTGQEVLVHHLNHDGKVMAYVRTREGAGHVLVVLNLSNEACIDYAIGVPSDGTWHVRLNSDSRLYAEDYSDEPCARCETSEGELDGMSHQITLSVAAYSVLILSQDVS
jgi:1,4-alpha-glucan branching enzyme